MGVRAFPMPTTADHLDKEDICPKRFGLTYDPPSIVLEYLQTSTGKLFHRKIGLKRLKPGTDASRVAEKMRQKNEGLLAEDKVSFEQLVSLVRRLQETLASEERKADASLKGGIDYQVTDLNDDSGGGCCTQGEDGCAVFREPKEAWRRGLRI